MKSGKIIGALLATALSGSAFAASNNSAIEMSGQGLPGVFQGNAQPAVRLAQAGDPNVQNLEEQLRALNGRVEELNFQINQMQEQLRKMQEDNEFRFQELEGGKKSDARPADADTKQAEAPRSLPSPSGDQTASTRPAADAVQPTTPMAGGQMAATPNGDLDQTSKTFGTITFDPSGNVTGGSVGDQATIPADPRGAETLPGADNLVVAALPQTSDPEELYRASYEFILAGQYATAEAGFADHAKRFPEDVKAADARFWLGEAQLGQRKYHDAAETFLAANKAFPKSKKAPEMMLKLGVSLVGLNQNDVACATFAEIGKRYPGISSALKERVAQEQAQAAC
ncbi:MAG: tol-pal system protein YbgF [Rhizobiaceae bacterium]